MNPTQEAPHAAAAEATKAKTPEVIQPGMTALAPATPAAIAAKPEPVSYFRGIPPEDKLNRMYGFSKAICNAAFISPVVRGDEASVFFLVSMAEDMGLQWTHGLRSIYPMVRRGKDGEGDQIRAGIQGDIALALLQQRKFKIKFKVSTDELATCWMERPDGTMEFEDSFSIAEAQRMNLLSKPNWAYKRDMLRWRALMRVARVVAADVLGGLHLPDEIEEPAAPPAPAPPPENPYAPKIKKDAPERGPQADSTPEAHEVQVEGPDTSTRAEAGSSAPAQQAGESGGAVAAALPKSGAGDGAVPQVMNATAAPETEKRKVTPISKPKQDPRVPALLAEIEKLLPTKQRKKIAEDYLRGYFNVTDVKPVMQDPRAFDALTMLLALCGDWRVQLIGDPHKYGVAAKLGWDKLTEFIKDWPDEQRGLARQMALQYADTGGEGLYDYFAALDLDKADPENRGVFLAVVWRIGIGKSASALWDCGVPIKDVVAGWGLDLAVCEPAEIVARIGDLDVVPPTEPIEPASMEMAEDEPVFDLFRRGGSEDLDR